MILIQAVLRSIPTYVMGSLKLLKTIYNKISGAIRKFWWNNNPKKLDKHSVNWEKWSFLCQHKTSGGLGFRNIQSFNNELVAKHIWKLVHDQNSLFS